MSEYKLTEYSHGAGCGCKISPSVLESIVNINGTKYRSFAGLLVGNDQKDDAAVMDLGDGTAIISTTDFFMPIVDDPATFGKIAAVNAISDIYAMGGTPLMAIAILGWPVDKIPSRIASEVVHGARTICDGINIPLAGGHSIDSPEPIFGLAVTGRVEIDHLKKNAGARVRDLLYLSKPLGVGILTTAQKKKLLRNQDDELAIRSMLELNQLGERLARLDYVHAMTDVTGFGLAGHLIEMCEASDVSVKLNMAAVPTLDSEMLKYYLDQSCIPGGTNRNYQSYGHKMTPDITAWQRNILCDPQTSGGLLISIDPEYKTQVENLLHENGIYNQSMGTITKPGGRIIHVR